MTKEELSKILHASCKAVNEGISSDKNKDTFPRIVYWDYIWEDILASGETYEEMNTFQVSVFAQVPPSENIALLKLRQNLRLDGIHPKIYHEYNDEKRVWHSYMAVEVERGLVEE